PSAFVSPARPTPAARKAPSASAASPTLIATLMRNLPCDGRLLNPTKHAGTIVWQVSSEPRTERTRGVSGEAPLTPLCCVRGSDITTNPGHLLNPACTRSPA